MSPFGLSKIIAEPKRIAARCSGSLVLGLGAERCRRVNSDAVA